MRSRAGGYSLMSPLRRWAPVVIWAAVIFTFSTSWFTSDNTEAIAGPFLHWLFPSLTPDAIGFIHHLIRKCGHLTEYFIFGWLVLRAIRAGRPGMRLAWALAAIGIVAAYASSDEYHQSFVPGRGASIYDVMLDTTGGAISQIAAALFALRRRHSEHRNSNEQIEEKQ
ncbi:MAG: VanZ family protein [Candidatus Acidiferrales bacterium]